MTTHVREHAFEPFFTTKPQGSGTGLGLSSVYGFVKQSGGHVALYSEAGQGTTVRIYLPLIAEKSNEPVDGAAAPGLPRGNGQLVLVVEDDEGVRRVTVSRLMQLGYNVVEAANGQDALAVLERTPDVGLLLTDMVMPGGMSGADLAAATRGQFPRLPVLFTSGYAGTDISGPTDLRPGDWLRKPYTLAEMAVALHRMFGR
jgi:CheY-like chemotaxis protein